MEGPSHKFREVGAEDIGLDRTRIDNSGEVEILAEDHNKPLPPPPPGAAARTAHAHGQPGGPGQNLGTDKMRNQNTGLSGTTNQDEPMGTREKLKEKAKNILHMGGSNTSGSNADSKGNTGNAPVLADSDDRISKARYVEDKPEPEHHKAKDLLQHPVDTITSKVGGTAGHQISANIAAKEIPHGQEVELVRAHDALLRSRNDTERLMAIENINELLQTRQDQFVRWTMDRHVQKVRLLPPSSVPWKTRKDFMHIRNGKNEVDWLAYGEHLAKYYAHQYGGEYIGYTASPPQPSKEVVMPAVERLLVASAPFQTLIMEMRKVYRWDNPNLTAKYLAGYGIVWAFNMVLPAALLSVVYLIADRKIHEPTLNDLRKDVMRTEDRQKTALSVTEFIEKEGDEGWVDELVRVVGPWLMIQLADLANLMEIMRNFYEWRVPSRTMVTIVLLTFGAIATAVTPAWLLMRVITFGLGAAFFGLFPISSRYPDYRLLASPIRWLFWKIPTHAEWAVQSLQAKGARFNESHSSGPSGHAGRSDRALADTSNSQGASTGLDRPQTHDPLGYRGPPTKLDENGNPVYIHDGTVAGRGQPTSTTEQYQVQGATALPEKTPLQVHADHTGVIDYGSYSCKYNGTSGQLVLTSHGVRFQHRGRTEWEVPYDKLGRLEKVTRQISKNLSRDKSMFGQDLKIVTTSPTARGEEAKFDEAKGQAQALRESTNVNAQPGGGVTGGTRIKGSGEGKNESTAGRNQMEQVEKKEEHGEHGEGNFVLQNVQERDQVFSQIIGYSHVKWVVIW